MKSGEIWKAKPGTPRCEWDMIELLRPIKDTEDWEVYFFLADDTPEEERFCEAYGEDDAYGNAILSRKEILQQFYRVD